VERFLFKRRFSKGFHVTEESHMATPDANKKALRSVSDMDGFRPLTDEEKQQFLESLNGKGRRILAELAGQTTDSIDPDHDQDFDHDLMPMI
jgi:hypothetical protein